MPTLEGKHPSSKLYQTKNQSNMSTSTSQWGEWVLDNEQQYYYRARHVSYDALSTIGDNARNTIVPDGHGHYTQYQFMTFPEVIEHNAAQSYAQQVQQAQQAYAQQVTSAQRMIQAPKKHHHDDGSSGSSGVSGKAKDGPKVVMTIERTTNGFAINLPKSGKQMVVVDKRTSKKAHEGKKKKVDRKEKVNWWLLKD